MNRWRTAVLVLATVLSGCAQGLIQPLPTVPEGTAAFVTVVRESTMFGAAASYIVTVDDRPVLAIRAGDELTVPVAAGWHTIGTWCGGRTPARLSVDERLERGRHYYYQVGPTPGCPYFRKITAAELPALEVTVERGTLADVEARLAGESGLARGPRPYEADFEGLRLTGADVPRLGALVKEAMASPPGSDLELEGTVDGRDFEASMEKDKAGRVRVQFEGLAFADEEQLTAFLAPFATAPLHELTVDGSVGGRPRVVKRGSGAPK
jgi:hypothetical protein